MKPTEDQTHHYRVILITASVVIPLLWLNVTLTVPNIIDPFLPRGLIASAFLGAALISYVSLWVKNRIDWIFLVGGSFMTAFQLYVTYVNHLKANYGIGSYIVIFSVAGTFNSPRLLKIYSATAVILTTLFVLVVKNAEVPRSPYLFGLLISLLIIYFGQMSRFNALKKLHEAKDVIVNQQEQLVQSSKMAALGDMAGGVAHEINSPLAALQIMAEQISENVQSQNINKSTLIKISDRMPPLILRIAKITNSLRTFSNSASSGAIEMANLRKIVDDTLSLGVQSIRQQGLLIENLIPNEIVVECRPFEISQVILNLVMNSADAVKSLSEKWIKLEANKTDEGVDLRITDSGNGIPEPVAKKIFDPFFTTKAIGNQGLGLSTSQGIIKGHQGQIVYDFSSKKTSFVISLPNPKNNTGGKAA